MHFRWFILLFWICCGSPVFAEQNDANGYFERKEFARALEEYTKDSASGSSHMLRHYRAAQCCAQLGLLDRAFDYLDKFLLEADRFEQFTYMAGDPNWQPLQSDPRWLKFTEAFVERWRAFDQHTALRGELARMTAEDQCIRFAATALAQKHQDTHELARDLLAGDRVRTQRLKEIVETYGWPDRGMVGGNAAHAAWLLAQHADQDRPFQKRCLELMTPLVARHLVDGSDFAYLVDRVRVGEKRKQLYGTQFTWVNGIAQPQPIEDPAGLASRRKSLALPTIEDYTATMQRLYVPK